MYLKLTNIKINIMFRYVKQKNCETLKNVYRDEDANVLKVICNFWVTSPLSKFLII